jgi:glycosyltransferase involved in cell wall biosynthesis
MVHPGELRRVRAHLARRRPDLVHTHLATSDFLGCLAARSLGIPSVTTIHADWWPDGPADQLRNWLVFRSRRHCADAVVAVSKSARNAYLARSGDRPDHVTVVHNGVADRPSRGTGARVRGELGLRHDDLVVTTLSALRPEKNVEAAIDALALLRDAHPRARLVIVGDGPHAAPIRRRAAPLGSAVVLAGHRDDPMAVLDATDVLVHPSLTDAFPTTLLEAMVASVPVVATGVGGIPEMIEDGESGILVAPPPSAPRLAASLSRLLRDPDHRAKLSAGGRRRFEQDFTTGAWARGVRAVYDEVLGRRKTATDTLA